MPQVKLKVLQSSGTENATKLHNELRKLNSLTIKLCSKHDFAPNDSLTEQSSPCVF